MGYYQQTLIPQQPVQRNPRDSWERRPYSGSYRNSSDRRSDGINSIVAYFERRQR